MGIASQASRIFSVRGGKRGREIRLVSQVFVPPAGMLAEPMNAYVCVELYMSYVFMRNSATFRCVELKNAVLLIDNFSREV